MINTYHFDNWADASAMIGGGMEFSSRGDTNAVTVTRAAPLLEVTKPYGLWEDNVGRAFTSVYNFMGTPAGTTIDTTQAIIESPETVPVDSATNGLLITLYAENATDSVMLSNLNITLTAMPPASVGDSPTVTGGVHYMLIETDMDLESGYILSGSVAFDWDGALPAADKQWFEIAPVVVVPEPAGALVCALGILGAFLRRR
jgi:hypothetical protein